MPDLFFSTCPITHASSLSMAKNHHHHPTQQLLSDEEHILGLLHIDLQCNYVNQGRVDWRVCDTRQITITQLIYLTIDKTRPTRPSSITTSTRSNHPWNFRSVGLPVPHDMNNYFCISMIFAFDGDDGYDWIVRVEKENRTVRWSLAPSDPTSPWKDLDYYAISRVFWCVEMRSGLQLQRLFHFIHT